MMEAEEANRLVIERAKAEEIDVILKWRMETLAEVFDIDFSRDEKSRRLGERLEQANREYFLEHLPDDSCLFCFGRPKDKQEAVCCGALVFYQELPSPDVPNGLSAYLMNIYTAPAFRHRGFGRQIVLHLIEEARSRQAQKIYLESSEEGKPLYFDLGFRPMKDYMKYEI